MMEDLLERGDEKRVDACGRQGGVAGKLVADVWFWPEDLSIQTMGGYASYIYFHSLGGPERREP
jgi:hypothetical protein